MLLGGGSVDEREWLACTDPSRMLDFLRRSGRVSKRKLGLFACACCRRHASVLRGKRNRQVLRANEDFADGRITRKEMEEARRRWHHFDYPFPIRGTWQMALSWATLTLRPEAQSLAV